MGWSRGHSSHARRYGLARSKDFRMHSISSNAQSRKARGQVTQKCRRAAQVEIGVLRHAKLLDRGHVKVAGSIEVGTQPVLWTRPAVPYMASAMLQRLLQAPRLVKERVIIAIARPIQPPDFARGRLGSQSVQHRQNRCRSNARAKQDHGAITGAQGKAAARSADVQNITRPDLSV